ncbi:MAG TPA: hypothetical protein VL096_19175, partial [Pirellulaceae bacterium]|nr:hypothetical protein [Pirellulaceae bacterium]
RAGEALAELEKVVARWPDAEPRIYLHLALAYHRNDRRADARQALAQARSRGLQVRQLTPGDRALLDELNGHLAQAVAPADEGIDRQSATP